MAGNSTIRRNLALCLGAICLSAFASPASAETTSLSCEGNGTRTGEPAQPWHGSIDVDYNGGQITISALPGGDFRSAATVTAGTIGFQVEYDERNDPMRSVKGIIDRTAGSLDLSVLRWWTNGRSDGFVIQARCRRATQKF